MGILHARLHLGFLLTVITAYVIDVSRTVTMLLESCHSFRLLLPLLYLALTIQGNYATPGFNQSATFTESRVPSLDFVQNYFSRTSNHMIP